MRMQAIQMADWTEQQIREKRLVKEQEQFADKMNFEQNMHFNKLLEQEQTKHEASRQALRDATRDANLQLAKEKRDREEKEKQDLAYWSKHEKEYTEAHDFMTEKFDTTKSMLGDHRFKPYHFKGLRQDQID